MAENEKKGKDETENNLDDIVKNGSVITKNSKGTIHCLSIIGQIEGHYVLPDGQKATKYEHIIPLLVAIEESEEIDGLLIVLNTMGGDVEAGLAIAEMIASMSKPTVSIVLGGGHSIGVPLATSAKHSFIVPSATMTIHPVRINGLVIGVPQSFDYFEKMQERIIDFILRNSKSNKDDLRRMIMQTDEMTTDIGTILGGEEAVEKGLIDRVGSLGDALEELKKMIAESKS
jgi:ATP-dependent protease ClpP protease subunit